MDLAQRDGRYAYEAFEFVIEALAHAQKLNDRVPADGEEPGPEHHVSGPELIEGARDLALREFGLMARVVFKIWGIRRTRDIGEIVFAMIADGLLSKTDSDSLDDFQDVFDLDRALTEGYEIDTEAMEGLYRSER